MEQADDLLKFARNLREMDEGFAPVITYRPKSRDDVVVAIVQGQGSISDVVRQALLVIRSDFGPPEWFAVTADTYGKMGDGNLVPGELAEAFFMGDPTVTEQIVVLLVEEGGTSAGYRQVYRHTPVDGWEWDNPEPFVDESTDLLAVMRSNI